jgi:hypothetical protein
MQNTKRGFIGIVATILIAFIILGSIAYFYKAPKNQANTPIISEQVVSTATSHTENPSPTTNQISLTDAQFIAVSSDDPQAKVVARGDINGDGYEDAIVQDFHCGASCSINLLVVFNEKNTSAKLFKPARDEDETFGPSYMSSSAGKSVISNISIKNGIVTLTGKGLACTPPNVEEPCTHEKWSMTRTVTYKFNGTDMIQLSINPPLPPPSPISRGTYQFSEFSRGSNNELQTWAYVVNIKSDDVVGPVSISVDGFQTLTRIYANGVGSKDSLEMVFDSYGPDNMFTPYKKGDVLFTLKTGYGGPSVEWKKMQPVLGKNKEGQHFIKTSN